MWNQFKVHKAHFIPPTLIQAFHDAPPKTSRWTCQGHQDSPSAGPDWAPRTLTCCGVKHSPLERDDSASIVKELHWGSGKLFPSLSSAACAPCDFSGTPKVTCMSHVCHRITGLAPPAADILSVHTAESPGPEVIHLPSSRWNYQVGSEPAWKSLHCAPLIHRDMSALL